ncbi:MAG: type IV pilin [Methanosarcina sp.]|nr:type IV pilin [Methanosarcina sp.]
MDFKKLFRKDEKAVSPVIGVILMVAITVILAAAIGSSVFSKGTAEAAPQANLNMKADGEATGGVGTVRIEHLGGDIINKDNIKITAYVGSTEKDYNIDWDTLNVGDVKTFTVGTTAGNSTSKQVNATEVVNIKMIDKTTNQLICDKNVRF